MLSVPLSEQPDFNALSYMWGNAEADTYIIIDGLKFLVLHNLLMFLKRYCQEERPKSIWIDAICINQLDLQERTQQVQLMGKVYEQAATVIVWLGEDPSNDLQVLDTETAQALLSQKFYRHSNQNSWDFIMEVVTAVICFMSNRYWNRTWIVQEILLARVVTVYYGRAASVSLANVLTWRIHTTEMINSMQFSDAVYQWRVTLTDPQTPSNKIFNCKFPNREGDWFQAELRSRKTANMIAQFITTECTDPRDKVYAFLGMSRDQENYGVVADYTRNAADLFFRVCDAQTQTWPGRRLAFARSMQNALDCTFDILTRTESYRRRLESGASDFVKALGSVDDKEQQDFANTRDEQSLHAVIVSSTYTATLEDNDKLKDSISARSKIRQVIVLSRTHIHYGDLLFRLNGSHLYMKYRKNAANLHCPLRNQHFPACGSDSDQQHGNTEQVTQSPRIRKLPAAALRYRPKAHGGERLCCLQDNRNKAGIGAEQAGYTGEEDEKTRAKRVRETIETVEELFPRLTCEGSC
jgi:hypothetical protein